MGTEVRVGTLNLGDGSNDSKHHDIERLLATVDVLAMQEAGDRGTVLHEIAGRRDVGLYAGTGRGASSVPILWRSDVWHARKTQTIPLTARSWAPEGVGPNWVKPKVLNVVWLRHRITGETITVASTHMPASLWARLRAALGRGLVVRVTRAAKQFGGPVYICADWNAKVGAPILRPLRRAGLRSAQAKKGPLPTHGRRAIDDVWTKGARVTDVETVKTSSDHRALIVTSVLP